MRKEYVCICQCLEAFSSKLGLEGEGVQAGVSHYKNIDETIGQHILDTNAGKQ